MYIDRLAWLVSSAINILAIVSLAALVVLLACGSIARYGFRAPVPYTEELSSLLFVAVSFLGLAKVFVSGGHITFGGRSAIADNAGQPVRRAASLVFAAVVLGVIFPPTLNFATLSMHLGARSDVAELLLWPWMFLIPLGIAALLLVVISQLLALALAHLRPNPEEPHR